MVQHINGEGSGLLHVRRDCEEAKYYFRKNWDSILADVGVDRLAIFIIPVGNDM